MSSADLGSVTLKSPRLISGKNVSKFDHIIHSEQGA